MHCKSYSHFFSKKFQHICVSLDVNFNESLTNDVVSFEQLGPDFVTVEIMCMDYLKGAISSKAVSSEAGLGGSVGCSETGDQEVSGSTPAGSATFFHGD